MKATEISNTAEAGTTAASVGLAKGSQLGKYRLDRVLGEGGMGVVWAAHDPDLERKVAIKVLRYEKAALELRQRLLREARAMAKLKHPNVLTVYEVGTAGDRDYIAMELVDGMSLDQWLALEPHESEIWTAILAAGRGLAAAHDAGVVHRDFKPHNVLRSRDGRVLVTDFGLARGLLGEGASAVLDTAASLPDASATPGLDATMEAKPRSSSGSTPRDNDSLLDAPMTRTGALIGTPAYMSPEQYRGAPPDPRTDQFAFCVTAWQALTGERPFKGQTLEEMRKAVGCGVAHIQTKLPRDVRAVLARGLAPKAEDRWPSLEALLDELDRVVGLPVRRKRLLMTGAALAIVAAAMIFVTVRREEAIATACDAPEEEFAEAWSPAIKGELQRAPGVAPEAFARVANAFDSFSERWIVNYQKACRTRAAKQFPQRIRCLESVRDEVSALTLLLRSAPPSLYHQFDAHSMLPYLGRCEKANPDVSVLVPREQPRRSQVLALMARSLGTRALPPELLPGGVMMLEQEANAIGWKPAVAGVLVTGGMAFLHHGNTGKARELFTRALPVIREANDRRFESVIRVGQLEASMMELENPLAPAPARITDPRTPPMLHPELANALTIARSATADDPMMLASVAGLSAEIHRWLAQSNRYRSAYDEAIQLAQEARKQYGIASDLKRVAQLAATEANIYLQRADARALDDALFTVRRAADDLERAGMDSPIDVDLVRIEVAFARRDYTEVHRIIDRWVKPEPGISATISGRVTPPGRARVVAWRGDMIGDPRRAFTDPSDLQIDVTETDEDGTFTIRAEPGWAIMAESADTRSAPQVIGTSAPALVLQPTTTTSGTARGRNMMGVHAFARFAAGASTWTVEVPIERDGTYDLRGLPAGATPHLGTIGDAGHGERRVRASDKQLTWPSGQSIDVIVRATTIKDARVWVLGGAVLLTTRRAIEDMAGKTADVATANPVRIGAANTDAGREHYQVGDRHAVITGFSTGEHTVCAANGSSVACSIVKVAPTVEVELPDGRYAAGVTPVVLRL